MVMNFSKKGNSKIFIENLVTDVFCVYVPKKLSKNKRVPGIVLR